MPVPLEPVPLEPVPLEPVLLEPVPPALPFPAEFPFEPHFEIFKESILRCRFLRAVLLLHLNHYT